jgi:phosphonopyruvate decarboxylase
MTLIKYEDSVAEINRHREDAVCVTTMTQTRYWYAVSERSDLDVGISNGMSKASSVGLGIALGAPERKVLVLDGDGSLLMNLGSLVTVAGQAPANYYHFVFNNGIYAVTGGQPVPGKAVDYVGLARASGYRDARRFDSLEEFAGELPGLLSQPGPILIEIATAPEPADHGVDQTWESNARMPRQMRAVKNELASR